jgi:hypothetical protein
MELSVNPGLTGECSHFLREEAERPTEMPNYITSFDGEGRQGCIMMQSHLGRRCTYLGKLYHTASGHFIGDSHAVGIRACDLAQRYEQRNNVRDVRLGTHGVISKPKHHFGHDGVQTALGTCVRDGVLSSLDIRESGGTRRVTRLCCRCSRSQPYLCWCRREKPDNVAYASGKVTSAGLNNGTSRRRRRALCHPMSEVISVSLETIRRVNER